MSDDFSARLNAEEDQARMGTRAFAARIAAFRNQLLTLGFAQDEAFVLARDQQQLTTQMLFSPTGDDE